MKLNRSRLFYGSLHWLKLKGQWECWVALCVCMYMCVYEVSFVCVFLQVSACVCVYSIQAVNPSFYPLLFFLNIGFLFTVCTCEHAFCLTSSQFSRGLWCSGWLALCQSIRSSLCCVCSPPPAHPEWDGGATVLSSACQVHTWVRTRQHFCGSPNPSR